MDSGEVMGIPGLRWMYICMVRRYIIYAAVIWNGRIIESIARKALESAHLSVNLNIANDELMLLQFVGKERLVKIEAGKGVTGNRTSYRF